MALYSMKAIQTCTPAYVPPCALWVIFLLYFIFLIISKRPKQRPCSLLSCNLAPNSVQASPILPLHPSPCILLYLPLSELLPTPLFWPCFLHMVLLWKKDNSLTSLPSFLVGSIPLSEELGAETEIQVPHQSQHCWVCNASSKWFLMYSLISILYLFNWNGRTIIFDVDSNLISISMFFFFFCFSLDQIT